VTLQLGTACELACHVPFFDSCTTANFNQIHASFLITQPITFHHAFKHNYGCQNVLLHNFRIDFHHVIKVSDFGLTEDVYAKNYFRQGQEGGVVKLPVKWMSPESLNDGIFTEKTDVVLYIQLYHKIDTGKSLIC